MAANAWAYYDSFLVEKNDGTMDLDTDNIKMALFLSTSDCATASEATYAGLTNEHANSNGYTTGGITMTNTLTDLTGSVRFDLTNDAVWTASGGSITARYAVLYNSTTGGLIGYSLLDNSPADVTATDGNTFTVTINASGVFVEAPA